MFSFSSYFTFSILSLVVELLKGLIIGKEYYKPHIEVSKKSNILRLKKLKEMVKIAKDRLDRYSSSGIDVSEQYDVIVKIPLKQLEVEIEKGEQRKLKQKLEHYLSLVETALNEARNREEIAKEKWPEWKEYIKKRLEGKDKLSVDAFINIPKKWRIWALTKYIEEEDEEGVVLEGNVVRKKLLTEEEKARRILSYACSKGLIKGGVIFKEATPLTYYFCMPKKTLYANLLGNLIKKAKTLIKPLGIHRIEELTIEGKERSVTIYTIKGFSLALLHERGKEKDFGPIIERFYKL